MALFKIFKGSNTDKLLDPNQITLTDGYCYFDTNTGLFYIDAERPDKDENGNLTGSSRLSRGPINAYSAIADANGKLLTTHFTEINSDIAALASNVSIIETTVDNFLTTVFPAYQESITTAIGVAKNEAISAANTYTDTQLTPISNSISTNTQAITVLQNYFDSLSDDFEDLSTDIANQLTALHTTITEEITTAKSQAIAASEDYTDQEIEKINTTTNGLAARLSTAEADIHNLETALNSEAEALTTAVSELSEAITAGDTAAVNTANGYTDGQIQIVNQTVAEVNTALTNLEGQYDTFVNETYEEDKAAIRSQITSEASAAESQAISTSNEYTDTQINIVQGQIDTLNTITTDHTTQLGILSAKDSALDDVDASLQAQITSNDEDIAAHADRLNGHDADIEALQTTDTGLRSDLNDTIGRIDAIDAASDVVDVVGTKAALDAYNKSNLTDQDIIKVLTDESNDNAITYYRYSDSTKTFTKIGNIGPYYTISEANALLSQKVHSISMQSDNSLLTFSPSEIDNNCNISIDASLDIDPNDLEPFQGVVFVNGTQTTVPRQGLVPAPANGTKDKFLKSDGTWGTLAPNKITLTAANDQTTFNIPFDYDQLSSNLTVFYNGLLMKEGDHYSVTNGRVTLNGFAAQSGDIITILGIIGAANIDFSQEAINAINTLNAAVDQAMSDFDSMINEAIDDLNDRVDIILNDLDATISTTVTNLNNTLTTITNEINTKMTALEEFVAGLPNDTTQLMAKNIFNQMTGSGSIRMASGWNPSNAQDVATKNYVDQATASIVTDIWSIGSTPPNNGKLLWIDINSATGGLKYCTNQSNPTVAGNWAHVPVAWS